jgi:hypothetical protein
VPYQVEKRSSFIPLHGRDMKLHEDISYFWDAAPQWFGYYYFMPCFYSFQNFNEIFQFIILLCTLRLIFLAKTFWWKLVKCTLSYLRLSWLLQDGFVLHARFLMFCWDELLIFMHV